MASLGAAVRATSTSQGAPLWIPLTLLPLLIGQAIPYLIPASLLTAVILTYGRMNADGEAMALSSAGVKPARLLRPALWAGLLAVAVIYPFSSQLLPRIYQAMTKTMQGVRFAALQNPNPNSSSLDFKGLHLSWRDRNPDGELLGIVLTHDSTGKEKKFAFDPGRADAKDTVSFIPGQGRLRLRADRGRMIFQDPVVEFRFKGLRTFRDDGGASGWSARSDGESWLRLDLTSMGLGEQELVKPKLLSSSEIWRRMSEESLLEKRMRNYSFALWSRASIALSALPLALLGALLGWRNRRHGFASALGPAFSVLIFLYYPLSLIAKTVQENGSVSPIFAAWMPLAGLVLALVLFATKWRPGT